MERVSCHTHTFYSGHGQGSVEQLVAAAQKAQLSTLAITEHYPLSRAMDPTGELALTAEQLPDYIADVRAAQQKQGDTQIILGAEFDWLGAHEDRALTAESFEPFAYTLLSVHFIDGWGFDDPAEIDGWNERGVDDVWRRYGEIWLEAVQSSWPATAMAHPDLVKKFGFMPHFDLRPLYRDMVEAVVESGRMIELNAAGAYYPCQEMYPAPDLLREFCRAGVCCSVGSDAHSPELVDRGLDAAYKMLYEAGYRAITVPCADGDRRSIRFE